MIKTFRLRLRRIFPRIKRTEHRLRHTVHIIVHRIQITQKQRLNETVVIRCIPLEPPFYHAAKHHPDFQIREGKLVIRLLYAIESSPIFFIADYLQISARQKQTPDCHFIRVKLIIHNLLIHWRYQMLSGKKPLKRLLYLLIPLPNQIPYQAVSAGIRPVWP